MTEKQYRKADAMVFATLMVVIVGIFLNMLGMLSSGGSNTGMTIVTLVSVIGAIATVLGYRKLRGQRSCGIFMTVIDGYPVMNEEDYLNEITRHIEEKHALVLKDDGILVGAMAFSDNPSCIDYLGIHPQYRKQDIQKLFLDILLETYLPGKEISMTTYREGDRADTGHRELLKNLGFAEKELMIEYGYPTQRFTISPKNQEDIK